MSFGAPVTLTYNDKQYEIPADSILPLIAQIEDVITLSQLIDTQKPSPAKLSMAFGIALRHAGAKVTDSEIYASVFKSGSASAMTQAVAGLMALMIPPVDIQNKVSDGKKAMPAKTKNKA